MEDGRPGKEDGEEETGTPVAGVVEASGSPLHGDLLQTVLSRLSLIHLLPVSCVSRSWRRAVALALRTPPRLKPWLIIRRRTSPQRSPAAASVAYDPGSGSWIRVPSVQLPSPCPSPLRSSHGSLLYSVSPSRFSLSWDALNFAWCDVRPPMVWRADPLVAVAGNHVVVAGGACDFEDEPLAVEVYHLDHPRRRLPCESMPLTFKNSSSPVWLSVAASDRRVFVLGKRFRRFLFARSGDHDLGTRLEPATRLLHLLLCHRLLGRETDSSRTRRRLTPRTSPA